MNNQQLFGRQFKESKILRNCPAASIHEGKGFDYVQFLSAQGSDSVKRLPFVLIRAGAPAPRQPIDNHKTDIVASGSILFAGIAKSDD
jgi:hypothetical protein